jgi:anti-anti-sigma factor
MNIELTSDGTDRSARMRLAGDLDYVTTPGVVDAVSTLLVEQPTLLHLHLDCETLAFCDSAGLSGLLQIHRRLSSAGVQLHLDDRPPHLERILQITGTLEHLTAPIDVAATSDDNEPADISADSEIAGSRGERNG